MLVRLRLFDWMIALVSLALCVLMIAYWREQIWLIAFTGALAIFFFILGYLDRDKRAMSNKAAKEQAASGRVKSVILLNEEGRELASWDLFGRTSLVIGRDVGENQVDINLGDVTYAGLIDIEHAVLNYAGEHWYVEDLHSENGVKVQKRGDTRQYKLATDKPCRLEPGDAIYIANTKLRIR